MKPPSDFRFTDLLPEIRITFYENIFAGSKLFIDRPNDSRNYGDSDRGVSAGAELPSILLVSRDIRKEALEVFTRVSTPVLSRDSSYLTYVPKHYFTNTKKLIIDYGLFSTDQIPSEWQVAMPRLQEVHIFIRDHVEVGERDCQTSEDFKDIIWGALWSFNVACAARLMPPVIRVKATLKQGRPLHQRIWKVLQTWVLAGSSASDD